MNINRIIFISTIKLKKSMNSNTIANAIANTLSSEERMKQVSCLTNCFKKILKMPYYKNYSAASGAVHNMSCHEDSLADVLVSEGFTLYKPTEKLNSTQTQKWLENPTSGAHIPNMTFIVQPLGTHNSPDFIIKCNHKFIFLEAKSSETSTTPTFNSGGVKKDYIYAFCSKKTNETTIFKGDSIITREQQRLIDLHIEEARQRDKELNEKLKELDINHRGIQYYTRPMINQGGGASYTNYFKHDERNEVEEKVFKYIEELFMVSDSDMVVPETEYNIIQSDESIYKNEQEEMVVDPTIVVEQ